MAQTTWTGGAGDGRWNTRANWNPAVTPSSTQTVIIPLLTNGNPYPTVLVGSSLSCGTLSVAQGATLTLNGSLTLNGPLTNAGTILIQPPAGNTKGSQLLARKSVIITTTGVLAINVPTAPLDGGNFVFSGFQDVNATLVNNGSITSSDAGVFQFSNGRPVTVSGSGTTSLSNVLFPAQGNAELTLATDKFIDVRNIATLDGSDVYSQGKLRLTSNATSTGMLRNKSIGVISDEIYVQRYIDPVQNASAGYRHYSAPVAGATFAMFEDGTSFQAICDPNMTAYPALQRVQPFANIYLYNQDLVQNAPPNAPGAEDGFVYGFQSVPTKGTTMDAGRGYTVNIDASNTVTLHGVPRTGPIECPNYGRGTHESAGRQFVGNPYPSYVSMRLVVSDNMQNGFTNTVYKYVSTGQYTGYYQDYKFADDQEDMENQFWPMMQGFFVRRDDTTNEAPYTFTEDHRVYSPDPANAKSFNRVAAAPAVAVPTFNLTVSDNADTKLLDNVRVSFRTGATGRYDSQYDSERLADNVGENPTFFTVTADNKECTRDARPALTGTTTLPLGLRTLVAGHTYSLKVGKLALLAPGQVYLEDRQTGKVQDLLAAPTFTFTADRQAYEHRFFLRFEGTPGTTRPLAPTFETYPNPVGTSRSLQFSAHGLSAGPATAALLTVQGIEVLRQPVTVGGNGLMLGELSLADVKPGLYLLRFTAGNTVVTKRLEVR